MTLVSIHGIVFYRGGTQWLSRFILCSMFLSFHLEITRIQTRHPSSFLYLYPSVPLSIAKTLFAVPPEFTRPAVKGHPGHSFPSPSVPSVNSPNATFVIPHGKDSLFVSSASGPSSPLHSVLFSLSERGNAEKHRPINRCAQSLWTRKMLSLLEALIWRTIEAYRKMRKENWHLSGA